MKRNDVVEIENQNLDGTVYKEGSAILFNKIKETYNMEYWRVKFINVVNPYFAFRWIRK